MQKNIYIQKSCLIQFSLECAINQLIKYCKAHATQFIRNEDLRVLANARFQ